MSVTSELRHVRFCLDELTAEFDEHLLGNECVRALKQLDEREAQGQPLDVVCGRTMRSDLEARIAGDKVVRARRKLDEIRQILAEDEDLVSELDAPALASPPPLPQSSTAPGDAGEVVINFAQRRSVQGSLHARQMRRAFATAVVGAFCWLASSPLVGTISPAPIFDMSVARILAPGLYAQAY